MNDDRPRLFFINTFKLFISTFMRLSLLDDYSIQLCGVHYFPIFFAHRHGWNWNWIRFFWIDWLIVVLFFELYLLSIWFEVLEGILIGYNFDCLVLDSIGWPIWVKYLNSIFLFIFNRAKPSSFKWRVLVLVVYNFFVISRVQDYGPGNTASSRAGRHGLAI